jgi:hypothetical protein
VVSLPDAARDQPIAANAQNGAARTRHEHRHRLVDKVLVRQRVLRVLLRLEHVGQDGLVVRRDARGLAPLDGGARARADEGEVAGEAARGLAAEQLPQWVPNTPAARLSRRPLRA